MTVIPASYFNTKFLPVYKIDEMTTVNTKVFISGGSKS